jgi:hypothetical protein
MPDDALLASAGMLTGQTIFEGTFKDAGRSNSGWARGISLDQHLAGKLGGASRFKSLELGVMVTDNEVRGRVSYAGPNMPMPPTNDPYVAFDRLFGGAVIDPGGGSLDRLRMERKSVLDFVVEETNALRGRLGGAERAKLDSGVADVRRAPRRLSASG